MVVLNADGTALGAPVGGATSANQTNGTQKSQIVDAGGEAVTVTGGKLDVNATASLAGQSIPSTGATEAVTVQVVDGSGNQISSFGGGNQYTEGDTDATITGTAVMFETNTGTNTLGVVNATNPLPVSATIDTTGLATTTTDTNTGTIAGDTTSIDAKIPALGQALASASVPVVLTAAQLSTLTPPAAISGFATSAKQDTGNTSVASIDTKTPALGQALAAASVPVILPAATITTLTPPAAITGFATAANQLPDGHNVTVDNASLAVTGTFWQATQPVSGTVTATATDLDIRNLINTDVVTAELSAVDNAVLDTIAAKDFATQTTLVAMNAKLVTGTVIGDVNLGATDNAVLDAIEADTTIIAGAVSATHMQVDVVGALPAGTAVIGKTGIDQTTPGTTNLVALTAETTKVIGTVRVASGGIASGAIASGAIASGAIASGAIAAGAIAAGATSIATTEDTASAAADHLVKIAAIRRDTPVANDNTSNDGDYTQLKLDNFGKLWTSGSAPEDVAHVAGEALTIGGVRRIDTPATSAGTSGDWATMDASAEGALWATLTPTTTGGCAIFRSIDLDETEEEIKATAGNLYGYYFYNAAATVQYLKFYNATAANVTVGTTTPVLTFPLPAGAAANISLATPAGFSTAITAAATTGIADNDTGAPAANSVVVNVFYK